MIEPTSSEFRDGVAADQLLAQDEAVCESYTPYPGSQGSSTTTAGSCKPAGTSTSTDTYFEMLTRSHHRVML